MNMAYSSVQLTETGNIHTNFKLRQYEIDLMFKFIEIKSNSPNLTKTAELNYSYSTIKRYRSERNMPNTYDRKKLKEKR